MTASATPGKGFLAKALGAAAAQPIHPVVSAVQFAHLSRTTGGASMEAGSGRVLHVGKDTGYSVGQGKDKRTGQRVPTQNEPLLEGTSDMRLDTILAARRRIAKTGDSSRLAGSFDARLSDEPRNEMDIDAADHFPASKGKQAKAAGVQRGEDAIFDLHKGDNISTMKKRPRGVKL